MASEQRIKSDALILIETICIQRQPTTEYTLKNEMNAIMHGIIVILSGIGQLLMDIICMEPNETERNEL